MTSMKCTPISPALQVEMLRSWNEKHDGLNGYFSEHEIGSAEREGARLEDLVQGLSCILVLEFHLASPLETFRLLITLISQTYHKPCVFAHDFDPESFVINPRIREKIGSPARGLRWTCINLMHGRGKSPSDVLRENRNRLERIPGLGVVHVALYHYDMFQTLDGTEVPYPWIPGCSGNIVKGGTKKVARGQLDMENALFIGDGTRERIEFGADPVSDINPMRSVPLYVPLKKYEGE